MLYIFAVINISFKIQVIFIELAIFLVIKSNRTIYSFLFQVGLRSVLYVICFHIFFTETNNCFGTIIIECTMFFKGRDFLAVVCPTKNNFINKGNGA